MLLIPETLQECHDLDCSRCYYFDQYKKECKSENEEFGFE